MSSFINPKDYDSSIRRELLDAITREDAAVLEMAEDAAILEMKPYLNAFNTNEIFAPAIEGQPDNRNKLVLMFAKDITIFHLWVALFGNKENTLRKSRYERAIQWLKEVSKGDIVPSGLPPKIATEKPTIGIKTSIAGNPKSIYHF